MRFVVEKVVGQVSLRVFEISHVSVIPLMILTHSNTDLSEGQAGEAWELLNKQFSFGHGGTLDRKLLRHCFVAVFKGYNTCKIVTLLW